MTVTELIQHLLKMPPEAEVKYPNTEIDALCAIHRVALKTSTMKLPKYQHTVVLS